MGALTAVASTSLITFANVGVKIPNINGERRSETNGNKDGNETK
jgi:hypothetical protein